MLSEDKMNITHYTCGSCAVSSMQNIGFHKNPEDVMKTFCASELGKLGKFNSVFMKVACFYIFCAGPEVKHNEKGGSHHSKDHWPKYGTELAQYIVDNKLGEIVTIGPKLNLKHHAKTTAQLWAWSPDQTALETWWKENGGAPTTLQELKMPEVEVVKPKVIRKPRKVAIEPTLPAMEIYRAQVNIDVDL